MKNIARNYEDFEEDYTYSKMNKDKYAKRNFKNQ